MRYRQVCTLLVVAVAFVLAGTNSAALASDDYFGDGDGHHGAKSVTAPEVVNAYSALAVDVVEGDMSIEVADGTKFTAGDLAIVWQVNGYATPASGDQTEIDLAGQPVGRFEFLRVDSVVGNVLGLRDPTKARVQCRTRGASILTATGFPTKSRKVASSFKAGAVPVVTSA
jgi:hypothetical protein